MRYLCVLIFNYDYMRRFVFTCLIAMVVIRADAQIRLGISAGGLYAGWNVAFDGVKDSDYEGRMGFLAGLVAELPLGNSLALQPQFNFVHKGTSVEHGDHHDAVEVNALDIPLSMLFRYAAGPGEFFLGLGPNIGINLEAHLHEDHDHRDDGHGHSHGEHITIGNDPGNLKRMDIGARLSAGYTLRNGLSFSASYVLGLSDLTPEAITVARSNYAAVTLGYYFLR